jgi:alpha-tubulin suppressor-like RCC1 family protein
MACSDTPAVQAPPAVQPPRVARLSLGVVGGSTLLIGDTARLVVKVLDSADHVLENRPVTCTSANTAIVAVTVSGTITALALGSAAVTATSEGVSAQATIFVSPAASRFDAIEVGGSRTCGLTSAGAAYCWTNALGPSITGNSQGKPLPVGAGIAFASITVAGTHTCALTPTGAAWCWGLNSSGQLGTNDTIERADPTPVLGGHAFSGISVGNYSTCAVTSDGVAYCWGDNHGGRLGNGSTTNSAVPVPVSGGLRFRAVSVGSEFTCGLTLVGDPYCWGYDPGSASPGAARTAPFLVAGRVAFRTVSVGATHACGVDFTGAAWCWGGNFGGDLGIGVGDTLLHPMPLPVAGNVEWQTVSSGDGQTCGIASHGVAYCWGQDFVDLLANGGPPTYSSASPAKAFGGAQVRTLSARGDHMCVLTLAGVLQCWGGYAS